MKKYGVNELRQMFLDFMESKGHLAMKSFSLDTAAFRRSRAISSNCLRRSWRTGRSNPRC